MRGISIVVMDHNEYPIGLKGEEMPYISGIIMLADAYDKITVFNRHRKTLTNDLM